MLTVVVRRALAQRRLVGCVVALVAVAATLVGVSALLLGPTQDRAFSREVQRYQPQQVDVDAFLVDLSAADLATVRRLAVEELRGILGPLHPTITATATSRTRDLEEDRATGSGSGGDVRSGVGYLATGDGIAPHAQLVSGRWPAPATSATEATVVSAPSR